MQIMNEVDENASEITHEKKKQQQPPNQEHKQQQKRSSLYYNNTFQFILSLIGMAVGYGSFWIFPYMIYQNGGGVFFIPYTIIMIFVGVPLLYHQTALGQMFQCSIPIGFGKVNRGYKWLAIVFLIMTFQTAGFYNIILAYSYRFLFAAFQNPLPFAQQSIHSNRYFNEQILGKSDSIGHFGKIQWILYFLYVASLIICYVAIRKGVQTSGKVTIFTALLPYVFFIALAIRGATLQGAWSGLQYLFSPQWEKLLTAKIWIDASKQAFFQLGIGIGGIWNFSSLRPKNSNLMLSTVIIPLSLFICGMLCALNIYMYLGHFSYQQGLQISELHLEGIQLSFNIFPKALAILPYPNIWVFGFFLSMVFLGIDTQFAFLEVIYYYIMDEYGKRGYIFKIKSYKVTLQAFQIGSIILLCVTFGLILTSSAGIYYVEYMDKFIVTIPVAINIFVQTYLFIWIFPLEEVQKQIYKSKQQVQSAQMNNIGLQNKKSEQDQIKSAQMMENQNQSNKCQNKQNNKNISSQIKEYKSQTSQRQVIQNQKKDVTQQTWQMVTPRLIYYSLKIPILMLLVFGNVILTIVTIFYHFQQQHQVFFPLGWIALLTPYLGSFILMCWTLERKSRKTFKDFQQMKTDQLR